MNNGFVLIGVEGDSSEVRAHHVVVTGPGSQPRFQLGLHAATQQHRSIVGFEPADMQEQLGEYYAGSIRRGGFEIAQAQSYIEGIVATVSAVAEATTAREVLVGIGFPGLKTANGRGIATANNMARAPELLDEVEAALSSEGIKLHLPIARLGNTADYCGVAEQYAIGGMFRPVPNAYYVGCGSTIDDAIKLDGELSPFHDLADWLKPAWQMPSAYGETYDQVASGAALVRRYANAVHLTPEEVAACGRFPELAAMQGEEIAMHLFTKAAVALAELIADRIAAVYRQRNGTLIERVVIGQRLGELYGKTRYRTVFRDKLDYALAERIRGTDDEWFTSFFLTPMGKLRRRLVVPSQLKAPSALGAAIDAYRLRGRD
jgi:hypothetical protein